MNEQILIVSFWPIKKDDNQLKRKILTFDSVNPINNNKVNDINSRWMKKLNNEMVVVVVIFEWWWCFVWWWWWWMVVCFIFDDDDGGGYLMALTAHEIWLTNIEKQINWFELNNNKDKLLKLFKFISKKNEI